MTAPTRIPQRALIGAGAVGALVHIATLFPAAWALYQAVPPEGRRAVVVVSGSLVVAVIACGLALLLVVRAGHRREARGLSVFLILIAVCWGSILRFASLERGPDGAATSLDISVAGPPLLLAILAVALASASLLSLSAYFPSELSKSRNGAPPPAWRSAVPWALGLTPPLLIVFGPRMVGLVVRALGREPETMAVLFPAVLWTIAGLITLIVLGMAALAVVNFVKGYRRAEGEKRRSALWLLVGVVGATLSVVASLLLFALDVVLPISLGPLSRYTPLIVLLAPLFMVVFVAVAILYSGAVDPRLALRRSTINGVAGTLGLLVFAGLENALSGWVEGRLGLPGSVGSFLAGAVSAGVFLPLQRSLTRVGRTRGALPD